ncbi:MAG TPA: hypothetical protein VNN73_20995 [Blastocatellia bacterium]|nr:hypothetical protein [Blastocatellia bacterium]
MKSCKQIKSLIDEAEKPDLFSFEVNNHIAACNDCRSFATERAALRGLIASGARVTAPANFDAVLQARLAEVKARRSFSWLSPAGFARMGAATAGLVVAFLVIQFSGLLSTTEQPQSSNPVAKQSPAKPESGLQANPIPIPIPEKSIPPVRPAPQVMQHAIAAVPASRGAGASMRGRDVARQPVPVDYPGMETAGVVLVRGQNGEREVPLPTVSVGAQPLLYVSTSRPATRNAGSTF